MRLGLGLPQFDYSVPGSTRLRWETVASWAERAEALGFASLWLADHLFMSLDRYGGAGGRYEGFEPLATLAALARRTTTAELGTFVLCSALRPARVTAKALATLDVLSAGRVVAGVGAGWNEAEFEAAGIAFDRPGPRLDALARDLDAMDEVLTSATLLPQPVQRPRPPLIVGGKGDRLIDVAVGHADGWNTVWDMTPELYRQRLEVVHRACERHGRDPGELSLSLGTTALVAEDESGLAAEWARFAATAPKGVIGPSTFLDWRQTRLVGTTEWCRERLGAFADLGVSEMIVSLGPLPLSVTDDEALDRVAALLEPDASGRA